MLGELNFPSYESLNNVSWAEFRIRLFSFKRKELEKYKLARIHALKTAEAVGYLLDSKSKNITLEAFWDLENPYKKKQKQKERLEILKKARLEYLKQKKWRID